MSAARISFWHSHQSACLGYFKKTLLSEKCPRVNLPDIGRAKRTFALTDTASAKLRQTLKIGAGTEERSHSGFSGLARRSALHRAAKPGARFGLLRWSGTAELPSLGAPGLDPCQVGPNPWGSDPWRREEIAARHGALRVAHVISPAPRLPALPSRPTSGALLSQWRW